MGWTRHGARSESPTRPLSLSAGGWMELSMESTMSVKWNRGRSRSSVISCEARRDGEETTLLRSCTRVLTRYAVVVASAHMCTTPMASEGYLYHG